MLINFHIVSDFLRGGPGLINDNIKYQNRARCREYYSVFKNGMGLMFIETYSEFIALVWEVRIHNLWKLRLCHGTTVFLKGKTSCFHTVFRKGYIH